MMLGWYGHISFYEKKVDKKELYTETKTLSVSKYI